VLDSKAKGHFSIITKMTSLSNIAFVDKTNYFFLFFRGEILYNILIEFGIPMKRVRLITLCLSGRYCVVRVGKHLSDMFPVKNGLKQGDALSPLLANFVLEYVIRRVQVN